MQVNVSLKRHWQIFAHREAQTIKGQDSEQVQNPNSRQQSKIKTDKLLIQGLVSEFRGCHIERVCLRFTEPNIVDII